MYMIMFMNKKEHVFEHVHVQYAPGNRHRHGHFHGHGYEYWTKTNIGRTRTLTLTLTRTRTYLPQIPIPRDWGLKDSLTHVSFYFFEGAAGNKYIYANDRPSKKMERDLLSHLKCKEITHLWGHSGSKKRWVLK